MTTNNLRWKTAKASGNNGGACVEVAIASERNAVLVRDTKDADNPAYSNDIGQPQIEIPMSMWDGVLALASDNVSGQIGSLTVTVRADGTAALSNGTVTLEYTALEWVSFRDGVNGGGFSLASAA